MARQGRRLTIFQKMLVAPLVGALLAAAFLLYLRDETSRSNRMVEEIRDRYLPARELAGENALLFDTIAVEFKDAVMASEEEWARNTGAQRERIVSNLARLRREAPLVAPEEVDRLADAFDRYYRNALALSLGMIGDTLGGDRDRLIAAVEAGHQETSLSFTGMKEGLLRGLSASVEGIRRRLDRLLYVGLVGGGGLTAAVVAITFAMSLSTRRSLGEVNAALMRIAQEEPDFSARLQREGSDELGDLVKWFNVLSEKLERDYKKIELLSITDKLTGLYNRTKIDELFGVELAQANRYGAPLSAIMIDMDHFKAVNDTYGHQAGDMVLRQLALILGASVRDVDFVGRWGGEEFVILSPNTTLPQAVQLAEKLRSVVAETAFGAVGAKTASFGVATFRAGDTEGALTGRADAALYRAKGEGRNRVVSEQEVSDGA